MFSIFELIKLENYYIIFKYYLNSSEIREITASSPNLFTFKVLSVVVGILHYIK